MHAVVPWHIVDNIFIHVNVKEKFRWILIVISFNDWCIFIYDSIRSALHDSYVVNEIKKYAQLLPMYLSKTGFYAKKGLDVSVHPKYKVHSDFDSFDVVHVENISQQLEGGMDCGVFISAYAEYLSHGNGIPILSIDSDFMRIR